MSSDSPHRELQEGVRYLNQGDLKGIEHLLQSVNLFKKKGDMLHYKNSLEVYFGALKRYELEPDENYQEAFEKYKKNLNCE